MKTIKLLFLVLIAFSQDSSACSCSERVFQEAITESDEIFLGRLIALREVDTYLDEFSKPSTGLWSATFEVEKKWKGDTNKYVEIFQAGTSCDFEFSFPSRSYIVYAHQGQFLGRDEEIKYKELVTWLCSRTMGMSSYNVSYEAFPDEIRLSGFNWRMALLSFGLTVLFVAVIRWYSMRR